MEIVFPLIKKMVGDNTGCQGGFGKGSFGGAGAGGGGGHGGQGGKGWFKGSYSEGGGTYGNGKLPCELGSGSGNASFGDYTTGGGMIGLPSSICSLSPLSCMLADSMFPFML